jgi:hypothetical protein
VYTSQTPTKPVRVVLGLEGGLMLPTVGRVGVAARFDFGDLDLSTRYSWLFEEVDGQLDTVVFGRTDLGIGFQTHLDVEFRLRVGLNHWVAGGQHDFGLSAGMGLEVHPGAPYTVNVEAGGGSLGLGGVVYARIVVGMMLGRAELGLGWDHTTLFTRDESSNVHVTGPVLVTRFWL